MLGATVGQLELIFTDLDALARQMADLAAGSAEPLCRADLTTLRPTILDILRTHRGLVAGSGVITRPDLLRDAPRWLEWWWTTAAGTPEALRINLEPDAPDFFDYTTADWYAPQSTGQRRVAGPYVDYACTNEYTVTLSTPVLSGGSAIGVAAADVLVSSLERRLLPALATVPRAMVLANSDGRVIASNSPRWAPGLRIPLPEHQRPLAKAPVSPLRSWMLIEVDGAGAATAAPPEPL